MDTDAVYVALDVGVLAPGEVACFMPEPGAPDGTEIEEIPRDVVARVGLAGIGVTILFPTPTTNAS